MKRRSFTQEFLAGVAGCTRPTINKMLPGKPVDEDTVIAVCECFEFLVEEVVMADELPPQAQINIEQLADTVREKIAPKVKQECGTMRLLDKEQDIGAIYTDVNIVESLSNRRSVPRLADLHEQWLNAQEEFGRLGWGRAQKRKSGLKAVENHPKLMIWGTPRSGKQPF